jgi:hypothetical protein
MVIENGLAFLDGAWRSSALSKSVQRGDKQFWKY